MSKKCKWDKLLEEALPENVVSDGGYVADKALKAMIRTHIKAKTCPAALTRSDLLAIAVRLNLVTPEQAAMTAPRNNTKSWKTLVNEAPRRPEPIPGDWLSDDELIELIEAHIGGGEVMPATGRDRILKQAQKLNIISAERAAPPAPVRLSDDELKQRLRVDYAAKGEKRPALSVSRKALLEMCLRRKVITAHEAAAKLSRPDRKEAAEEDKTTMHVVRKSGVNTILKGLANASVVKRAFLEISEQVSRLAFQRGFLVWLHLHRLVTSSSDLPDMKGALLEQFIRHCFTTGTTNGSSKATMDEYESLFPSLPLPERT